MKPGRTPAQFDDEHVRIVENYRAIQARLGRNREHSCYDLPTWLCVFKEEMDKAMTKKWRRHFDKTPWWQPDAEGYINPAFHVQLSNRLKEARSLLALTETSEFRHVWDAFVDDGMRALDTYFQMTVAGSTARAAIVRQWRDGDLFTSWRAHIPTPPPSPAPVLVVPKEEEAVEPATTTTTTTTTSATAPERPYKRPEPTILDFFHASKKRCVEEEEQVSSTCTTTTMTTVAAAALE
jgi:hypothetical protein